jgi:hypothetical protein
MYSQGGAVSIDHTGLSSIDGFTFVQPNCRGMVDGKERMRVVHGGSLLQSLGKSCISLLRPCKK